MIPFVLSAVLIWASPIDAVITVSPDPFKPSQVPYSVNKKNQDPNEVQPLFEHCLKSLSFLSTGDLIQAQSQLDLCIKIAKENDFKLAGPELWLALLTFQFEQLSGKATYRKIGEAICHWFCELPQYQGLPAMSDLDTHDQIPWNKISSLEDARFGAIVLNLAATLTENKETKQLFETKAKSLIENVQKWSSHPRNSFLLFAIPTDQERPGIPFETIKNYSVSRNVFIVSDENLDELIVADSTWSFLKLYRESLEKQVGKQVDKRARYQRMKQIIQSLNSFLTWMERNSFKVLKRNKTASIYSESADKKRVSS